MLAEEAKCFIFIIFFFNILAITAKDNLKIDTVKSKEKRNSYSRIQYSNRIFKIPAPNCPKVQAIFCNDEDPYRSINGKCNNLQNPWWGMQNTPFKRLLPSAYQDNFTDPKYLSVTGNKLPHPRRISLVLHPPAVSNSEWSLLFIYLGQIIAHDITLSRGSNQECFCGSQEPECITIWTLPGDYINQDQKCMTMTRSRDSSRIFNCDLGPREQINSNTHWLDASFLYSSDEESIKILRSFEKGQLRASKSTYSRLDQLPLELGAKCPSQNKGIRCYRGGDVRAEDNSMLLSVHTLWLREHNRLANLMAKLNPHWDDETLFQQARKCLIAEYQHIIYNEFLPALLGSQIAKEFDILPLVHDFMNKYDSNLYPQILNEFATSAFRSFHTLVPEEHILANYKYRPVSKLSVANLQFNSTISMHHLDGVLYGIISHSSYRPSPHLNPSINNWLFDGVFGNEQTKRWSLSVLTIVRGREHGIPSYNLYRRLCGLKYANSFNDLSNEIPREQIEKLRSVYESVHDIDLFTGIVSEIPIRYTVVGPTAACIIGKQFSDLKFGDRFFYENGENPSARFNLMQLNSIRQVTMSRILCDNSDIEFVQKWSFFMPHRELNPLVDCRNIPKLDLSAWK